jgi:hypothetical protein
VNGARMRTDRLTAQQIRQVLRLHFDVDVYARASVRVIAGKLNVSQGAVQDCLTRAAAVGLLWPLASAALTDEALEMLLSPPRPVAL